MALRKLYLVVDCEDDQQKEALQNAFNEISNARVLNSRKLLTMYPMFQAKRNELMALFNIAVSNEATMSKSMKIAGLLTKIMKK